MGGDGGSFCQRSELVTLKKNDNPEYNRHVDRSETASVCAISHRPLEPPVVVCELGNLYNKSILIEHLLSKNDFYAFKHVRRLKDVVQIKGELMEASDHIRERKLFQCPILSTLSFNGIHKFVVSRECGCIISQKALDEVGGDEYKEACAVCGASLAPLEPGNPYCRFIPLLPPVDVKDELRVRLLKQREAIKQAKKKKKSAKKALEGKSAVGPLPVETKGEAEDEEKGVPLSKKEAKAERKAKRRAAKEQKQAEVKQAKRAKLEKELDPRSKADPRFNSEAFSSIFLKPGDKERMTAAYMSGISTKPVCLLQTI